MRLQFGGVIFGVGTSFGSIFWAIFRAGTRFICRARFIAAFRLRRRSLVFAARLSGRNNASFEIPGFGRSRDGRLALVGGSTQLGITPRCLNVLRLRGYRTDVVLVSVVLLLRRRARFDPTRTPVVADVSFGHIRDPGIVGVVNDGGVHVIHVSVVGEVTTFPAAAFITNTTVAEAIVDAAVEAHLWSPISFMERNALPPQPQ